MKKIVFALLLVLFSAVVFAEGEPPEDLDKLQRESIKRFQVMKKGNQLELRDGRSKPYPGTPEEAAKSFMKDYHRMFKISKELTEFKQDKKSKDSIGYNIHFRQYYKDVPVYRRGFGLSIDFDNKVYWVVSGVQEIEELDVDPAIKPDELQGVMEQMHPEYGPIQVPSDNGPIKGKGELIIYIVDEKPVLAYWFFTLTGDTHDKISADVIVDASTGRILRANRFIIGE